MEHKNLKYDPNETDRLNDQSPVLASLKKTEPYTASQSYFGKLPDEILSKIHGSNSVPWFSRVPGLLLKPKFALTAAVTLVVVLIAVFVFDKPSSVISLPLTDYTLEDVLDESPELIENMDELLLLETLFAGNDELTDDYFDLETMPALTSDELDDYLLEEDLTPEILVDL